MPSNTVYPRQPKPGIKQLGKLDAAARIRRAVVAARNDAMQHIVTVFARYPQKTGRIKLDEFINEYKLVKAFARIYLDIECEQMMVDNEWIVVFARSTPASKN